MDDEERKNSSGNTAITLVRNPDGRYNLKDVFKHSFKDEKMVTIWLFLIFSIITTITTIIHVYFPWIFQVPSITGPSANTNLAVLVGNAGIALIALYHSFTKHGLGKTALFFFGSMIFAGIEENEWIIVSGRLFGHDTYFFTDSALWFFEIPVYTTLGWYFISYSCYEIINTIIPKARRVIRTCLAGLVAMSLDLFADPILVNAGKLSIPQSDYGFWVWENESTLRLFSIPMMNFIGWWLLVFSFLALFDYTAETIDSGRQDFKKASRRFFLCFVLLWLLLYGVLAGLDTIFQVFWSDVNIFPIDFP
ncbi:MAG: carotenoid biosynthesis protein [Promethearchaeota archaeon]